MAYPLSSSSSKLPPGDTLRFRSSCVLSYDLPRRPREIKVECPQFSPNFRPVPKSGPSQVDSAFLVVSTYLPTGPIQQLQIQLETHPQKSFVTGTFAILARPDPFRKQRTGPDPGLTPTKLRIDGNHRQFAGETDIPIAGLLSDLKQRGLLESTLVICAGEFGRLPVAQKGSKPGRDHNPNAFTAWFAGGGVKGGTHYGETDEIGNKASVNRVSINDLHATILALLGMDHTKLTYLFNGRNFRLTDVAGEVVKGIIA